jgi:EAL domain-containing protein (putative c-di-GMP-specific phosphodiesterase class I)
VPAEHRAAFDHRAMLMALFTAAKLGLRSKLALNVAPSVVRHQGMLQSLRTAAATAGIRPDRIILELSESEFADPGHAVACLQAYRAAGFLTALDDFGVGQTGLGILASVQPPLIKLDPHLVHGVADDAVRHAIVESIVALARRLGSLLVAEGVETAADARALRQLGINLQQGFFYAMPEIDVLPVPVPGTRP